MFNNIGLKTPRGSGTNGYIQRNLSFIPPKRRVYESRDFVLPKPPTTRKPDREVLLHKKKREIELECLEYKDELLTELGANPSKEVSSQVEEKVEKLRQKLHSRLLAEMEKQDSRDLTVEKERELDKMRNAFGIDSKRKEGDAFNFESDKQKQERRIKQEEERRTEAYKRLYGTTSDA